MVKGTKEKYIGILGVKVSSLTYDKTLKQIENWIKRGDKKYICVCAVHLIMECQKNKELMEGVNKSGLVTPDGMPLVWISQFLGNKETRRVYGPALTEKICSLAAKKGYKVFLLGGAKGQSESLAYLLMEKYKGLKIAGWQDTPIRPIPADDNAKIIRRINDSKAEIVLVGLGCPNQERWMIENRDKLEANALVGVGAAFDFISGKMKQAPAWMQNAGLEWFFRLLSDPRRLWKRYLIYNSFFVWLISLEILKRKAGLFSLLSYDRAE